MESTRNLCRVNPQTARGHDQVIYQVIPTGGAIAVAHAEPESNPKEDSASPSGTSEVEAVKEDRVVVESFEDLDKKVPGKKPRKPRQPKPEDPNLVEAKKIADAFWRQYAGSGQLWVKVKDTTKQGKRR
jgi:hypothetical protein